MILIVKKVFPSIVFLILYSCVVNNTHLIKKSPLLKPQEVRAIAKDHLLKIGIQESEYIIESGPDYYESGFWLIFFDSKKESTQLGTAFGVSVEDKNKKDVKLLPGM